MCLNMEFHMVSDCEDGSSTVIGFLQSISSSVSHKPQDLAAMILIHWTQNAASK